MSLYTEKTEISHADYLKLQGLLVIGHKHYLGCEEVVAAVRDILGENEDDGGHATDAVWEGYSADELLKKSDIKVIPPPPEEAGRRLAEKLASEFVDGCDGKSVVLELPRAAAVERIEEILRENRS